jgi:putative ABC transport system substrate-binding protein
MTLRRRAFIAALGGAAAWPLASRAQQDGRPRRVGVLMALAESDPEGRAQLSAFTQGLAELGWIDGRSVRLDVRWAASSIDFARRYAKELVDLQPDVIFADSTPEATAMLKRAVAVPRPTERHEWRLGEQRPRAAGSFRGTVSAPSLVTA